MLKTKAIVCKMNVYPINNAIALILITSWFSISGGCSPNQLLHKNVKKNYSVFI